MKLDSIGNITMASSLAVNNTAKDAEVAKKMSQFGFPPRRMGEGDKLLKDVESLHLDKDTRYDEQWQLSSQMEEELETIRPVFVEHVAIARFTFRHEPSVLRTFNVKSIASASNKWAWVKQAITFYGKVMPYAEEIVLHGADTQELFHVKTALDSIMTMREDRMHIKGAAEDATDSRNKAVKDLRAWVSEFRTAARLALKDNPQKLEAFGIKVSSRGK